MTPDTYRLRQRTEALIDACRGLEAAASLCRVGKTTLASYYDCKDPKNARCFMPIDVVVDLERYARTRGEAPQVLTELCHQLDGQFVRNPPAATGREGLLGSIAQLAKEHSDISAAILIGLADDGRLDPDEAMAARVQVREGQQVLAALDAALASIIREAR